MNQFSPNGCSAQTLNSHSYVFCCDGWLLGLVWRMLNVSILTWTIED